MKNKHCKTKENPHNQGDFLPILSCLTALPSPHISLTKKSSKMKPNKQASQKSDHKDQVNMVLADVVFSKQKIAPREAKNSTI
jgi:hypothetical protein